MGKNALNIRFAKKNCELSLRDLRTDGSPRIRVRAAVVALGVKAGLAGRVSGGGGNPLVGRVLLPINNLQTNKVGTQAFSIMTGP